MVAIQVSVIIIFSCIQNWCCHVPPTPHPCLRTNCIPTLVLELTVLLGSSLNTPSTHSKLCSPPLLCPPGPLVPPHRPRPSSLLPPPKVILATPNPRALLSSWVTCRCLCSSWLRLYQGGKGLDTLRTRSHMGNCPYRSHCSEWTRTTKCRQHSGMLTSLWKHPQDK